MAIWIFSFCSQRGLRLRSKNTPNYASKKRKKPAWPAWRHRSTPTTFGLDLTEHLRMHQTLLGGDNQVPHIVKECANYIERNGIIFGIYRLSGTRANIQKLRHDFETNPLSTVIDSEAICNDVHAVASVLRQYFRELPSFFNMSLYDQLLALFESEMGTPASYVSSTFPSTFASKPSPSQQSFHKDSGQQGSHELIDAKSASEKHQKRLDILKDLLLKQLPQGHYCTLKFLMRHLALISEHKDSTAMDSRNLAIVWTPNLLKPRELELTDGIETLKIIGIQAVIIEQMIKNHGYLFDDFESAVSHLDDTPPVTVSNPALSSTSSVNDFHSVTDLIVDDTTS